LRAAGRRVFLQETGQALKTITIGQPSAENGLVSFSFFEAAVKAAREREIQAVGNRPGFQDCLEPGRPVL